MKRLHNNFSPSTFNLHVFFQISLNCFLRILNIIIVIIISPTLSYFAYLLMKNSNLPFRCFKGWETFNLFSWWRNHQMEHINTTLLWGKIKLSNLRYSLFYYPHDSSLSCASQYATATTTTMMWCWQKGWMFAYVNGFKISTYTFEERFTPYWHHMNEIKTRRSLPCEYE